MCETNGGFLIDVLYCSSFIFKPIRPTSQIGLENKILNDPKVLTMISVERAWMSSCDS